jgi:hypothetical protein
MVPPTGCVKQNIEPVASNLVTNAPAATQTANANLADPATINKYPLLTGYSVIVIAVAQPQKSNTGNTYTISLTVIINGATQPTSGHLIAICDAYIKVYVAKSLNIASAVLGLDCTFVATTAPTKRAIFQGTTDFSYKSSVDVPASALESSNGATAVISFVATLLAVFAAML